MAGKQNNITKQAALEVTRNNSYRRTKAIDAIVKSTLYGYDYRELLDDRGEAMSHFCRAYNITDYGVTNNRIKGVFRKYSNVDGLEEYYYELLDSCWPGFSSEEPRMEDLLLQFINGAKEENEEEDFGEYCEEEYSDGFEQNSQAGFAQRRAGGINMGSFNRGSINRGGFSGGGFPRGGSSGGGFLSGFWNNLSSKEKAITVVVAVLLIMFIFFRDTFWSLVLAVVPIVGTIAIGIFLFKWLITGSAKIKSPSKKGRRASAGPGIFDKIQFTPSAGGFIWCGIMSYIGIGGMKNGGSPILALVFVALGLMGLFRTKK